MSLDIVVVGRQGQVARALAQALPAAGHRLLVLGRPEMDLARPESIAAAFAALPCRPHLVVNAAAHTAVDRAEDEPDLAFALNRDAPGLLAAAADRLGAGFLHFSTDYVFDGTLGRPYREDDATRPLGVYGASKLAGEAAVLAANPRSLILRTAWVCAAEGGNFLNTMLRLAGRAELGVVADQLGAPSFAADLAAAVVRLAPFLAAAPAGAPGLGVFHLTGAPHTSWHGFASAIFARLAAQGRPVPLLRAITTAEYPTRARRPADGRLDCSRIAAQHGIVAPDWRLALDACLNRPVG